MSSSEIRHNGVGDAAVQAKTGKAWTEWFDVLDAIDATSLSHKEIAAHLHEKCGVSGWWSQMVTVGYEQARGLRAKHQKADGYAASVSRTIAAPIELLSAAWIDDAVRERWLGRPAMTITRSTPGKSVRIRWDESDSRVDVYLYAKGPSKSQVSIEHSKLAGPDDIASIKAFWSTALDALKRLLESDSASVRT